MQMLEVRGLAKYFGRFTALRDFNVSVGRGEFVSLFGRNGAGKTTFLRVVAGLSRPSEGLVRIHAPGGETLTPQASRGLMGYLSHDTALYLDLTAVENLRFYAELHGLPHADSDLEARLALVGLAHWGHESVRNFSRGMQQRLAIARAFLHDPEVLLLDEPFTGLDQTGTEFLRTYLGEAHGRGKTCLMATHDVPLGYEMSDRLIVIEKGLVTLDVPKSALSLDRFQELYREVAKGS
ncbi:MAG: heme ABC exporter ATP-binding protein CcmA [Acidobacteria bacterium]|nr:heme ABC exporter ATP-binding protein CcmA [Acidobacteriota bacterium]